MSKQYYFHLIFSLIFITLISPLTPAQAQIDTLRVACVGNSITEGYTTTNPATDAYPVQLGTLLGNDYLVMNCGVSGRTMLRHGDYPIWNEQKFKNGLAFNPDIVTITLGTNDSKEWNWVYKDEFVNDYEAMIDTFRTLPSQPVVWLCLPPPAFSSAFGINDSIITTDIIPMIQQIAIDKGCPVIDFYSVMQSYSSLFPDGIHPNTAGSAVMAEVLYSALTGIPITQVQDENTAANRTVTASGSIDPDIFKAANLVDGSNVTVWKTTGFPAQAVVDLDSVQTIDLFQLDFGSASRTGYQFLIETAEVPDSWTTALDRTARTDTAGIILEKINPRAARYVRLTLNGVSYPNGDTVSVAELRVVKVNGGSHAPLIRAKKIGATQTRARYTISLLWPNNAEGSVIVYRIASQTGFSTFLSGYRVGNTFPSSTESITIGVINKYYAKSFLKGVVTTSDTIVVDTTPTAVEESQPPLSPKGILLHPAYPNPFNPATTISFTLPFPVFVSLKVFNLLGKEITTLVSGKLSAGYHAHVWNTNVLPSGIYFYRLQAGSVYITKKIVLMK